MHYISKIKEMIMPNACKDVNKTISPDFWKKGELYHPFWEEAIW